MKSMLLLGFILFCMACEPEDVSQPGNLVPRTVMEDTTLPSIRINGTKVHAEAFGDPTDPMVIFLHGGPGGDYTNALGLRQLTAEGFYVIFYDQRGSGLSQRHEKSTYDIDLMLEDLTRIIAYYRTSDSQAVFLIGHSWGGCWQRLTSMRTLTPLQVVFLLNLVD